VSSPLLGRFRRIHSASHARAARLAQQPHDAVEVLYAVVNLGLGLLIDLDHLAGALAREDDGVKVTVYLLYRKEDTLTGFIEAVEVERCRPGVWVSVKSSLAYRAECTVDAVPERVMGGSMP